MTASIPRRTITDPHALRALAHPLRLRMLEELAVAGPMTATELADKVDESPANCSWHLRQLAKFGYIEEAPGGAGRQRPWRLVVRSNNWGEPGDDRELVQAGDAAGDILMDREYQELRDYRVRRARENSQWHAAAGSTQAITWCTAEELDALSKAIGELVHPYLSRLADPESRPDGARMVRLVSWGIPAREDSDA